MIKSPRFAFATLATLAGLATALPAQAALTTFANFSGINSETGVRFQNSNPNNVSGVGGSLFTTAAGTSVAGARQVQFSFLSPGLTNVANVSASFSLNATTGLAAQTFGPFTAQSGLAGTFSFISNSAITANGISYAAGSNLLSGVFNDVSISGQTNASAAAYNGSTGGGSTIVYTSDFLTFANPSAFDLSISLTSLAPVLFAQSGRSLRSFDAYSTGSFSSEPAPTVNAVPEPSVWGLMIVGFGLVGVAARRRATGTVVA